MREQIQSKTNRLNQKRSLYIRVIYTRMAIGPKPNGHP